MAYCVYTDVQARAGSLASLAEGAFTAAIAWADRRINGRLRALYAVPFSPVPDEIVEISADLAAYYILFKIFIAGCEDESVKAAQELRQRAETELQAILDKKVTLGVGDSPTPVKAGIRSSTYGSTPSLRNFDGLNRPDYDTCPAPAPLTAMRQTAPETIDSLAGDL